MSEKSEGHVELRVLSLVYETDAGSGVLGDEVVARGHALEEWVPARDPLPRPLTAYDAIIAFGGGMHADEDDRYPWLGGVVGAMREALDRQVPVLGVCLGAQVLARVAGGPVGPAPRAEWGWHEVELAEEARDDPLFAGLGPTLDVFEWHSYSFGLPPGAVPLARTAVCLQAFRAGPVAWGVQWHPEITADTALLWGRDYPPSPGGVPVAVDLEALRRDAGARMAATNAGGRDLCGRFLCAAAAHRAAAP